MFLSNLIQALAKSPLSSIVLLNLGLAPVRFLLTARTRAVLAHAVSALCVRVYLTPNPAARL
jgi:hypothetical protein